MTTLYYCKNDQEVDLIMRFFEKEGYIWESGTALRSQYQNAPIIYCARQFNRKTLACCQRPDARDINNSLHVGAIRNKIIAELRR